MLLFCFLCCMFCLPSWFCARVCTWHTTCKLTRLCMLPFCRCFALFCLPSCFARFCACTTFALSHTRVNLHVYRGCVFLRVFCWLSSLFRFYLFDACLHMYTICISTYTCKRIRICSACFAYVACPIWFARVCTCTTYALAHTHVNLYVYTDWPCDFVLHVSLVILFARVCTCTTYAWSHTHVNLYVYTCCSFAFLLYDLLALFSPRGFAHVQHIHYLIHM